MADFTVTITVPDGKVPELREALKSYFGTKPDGTAYSNAELKALFDAEVRRRLKTIYVDYMEKQAAKPDLGETA